MALLTFPILIIPYALFLASAVLGLCLKKAQWFLLASGIAGAVFSVVSLVKGMTLAELSVWLVSALIVCVLTFKIARKGGGMR